MQHATHQLSSSDVAAATTPNAAQLAHPANRPGPEALAALADAESQHNTLVNQAQEQALVQTDAE